MVMPNTGYLLSYTHGQSVMVLCFLWRTEHPASESFLSQHSRQSIPTNRSQLVLKYAVFYVFLLDFLLIMSVFATPYVYNYITRSNTILLSYKMTVLISQPKLDYLQNDDNSCVWIQNLQSPFTFYISMIFSVL